LVLKKRGSHKSQATSRAASQRHSGKSSKPPSRIQSSFFSQGAASRVPSTKASTISKKSSVLSKKGSSVSKKGSTVSKKGSTGSKKASLGHLPKGSPACKKTTSRGKGHKKKGK